MVNALTEKMKEDFPLASPTTPELGPIVNIKEEYASFNDSTIIPNSVQHNVPAWTLFAMFFICIPLAGNIIREREDGSAFRLLTMPGSYMIVILGKMLTYVIVNLIQFALMLGVGVFLLPLLGLPQLNIGNSLPLLFLVAFASGLAATGFGLLVGTMATTHDQSSLFGSVFIIILAAIGGIWVPTFVMPDMMRQFSVISPLNWGLEAFYGIFVRSSGISEIYPYVLLLIAFFVACVASAYLYHRFKRMR
jgi:ABC-2 type transport system permease protein